VSQRIGVLVVAYDALPAKLQISKCGPNFGTPNEVGRGNQHGPRPGRAERASVFPPRPIQNSGCQLPPNRDNPATRSLPRRPK